MPNANEYEITGQKRPVKNNFSQIMDDFVNTDDDNENWIRPWKTYTKSVKNASIYFIPHPSNGNRDFGHFLFLMPGGQGGDNVRQICSNVESTVVLLLYWQYICR